MAIWGAEITEGVWGWLPLARLFSALPPPVRELQ